METFQHFADQYGYPALFIGVLLENAGLPVPGETAVLLSGFLASPAGEAHSVDPILGSSIVGLLGSPLQQGPFLAASALIPGRTAHFNIVWVILISLVAAVT